MFYVFCFLCDERIANFTMSTFIDCLFTAVAPVVPELRGDADTSNFDDIPDPDGGEETFENAQVC